MTALAPTPAGVLHRPADRPAPAPAGTPIAAYRDTFRLLLGFAPQRTGKNPCQLRHRRPRRPADRRVPGPPANTTAATAPAPATPGWPRSTPCSRYAALRHPEHAALIQRVLAIPPKRCDRNLVTFLTAGETDALLAAPRPAHLDRPPRPRPARCSPSRPGCGSPSSPGSPRATSPRHRRRTCTAIGKGRKERAPRCTPQTVRGAAGLARRTRRRARRPAVPRPARGRPLSRDAVERRDRPARRHRRPRPARRCGPSTSRPHTLRHSAPCDCCTPGNDITVIALWLGHEQVSTTHLPARRHEPERTSDRPHHPPAPRPGRYRAPDTLLAFLEAL